MKYICVIVAFLSIFVVLLGFWGMDIVYAQTWDSLDATVKISVCGNEVIEGGEDCEGDDLNDQTCQTLGFGPGTLSCDIACSFDTYECSPAPTPTPTATPQQTSMSTTTTSSSDQSTSVATTDSSTSVIEDLVTTITNLVATIPILPETLIVYDTDNDGVISSTEIFEVVSKWVASLRGGEVLGARKVCDINTDDICNLIDFSVLMYHVE